MPYNKSQSSSDWIFSGQIMYFITQIHTTHVKNALDTNNTNPVKREISWVKWEGYVNFFFNNGRTAKKYEVLRNNNKMGVKAERKRYGRTLFLHILFISSMRMYISHFIKSSFFRSFWLFCVCLYGYIKSIYLPSIVTSFGSRQRDF